MSLRELNEEVMNCRKCRLWIGAKQAVPGEGAENAEVMLVGQNPGKEEDRTGRPFVGRAGRFLNVVLGQMGINREGIFITNLVKHVTPENRKPLPDEIEACMPYLKTQILLIKPKTVVLMGTVAWQAPIISKTRYVKTVHPAAAMRFKKMRARFLGDFASLNEDLT